MAKCRATVVTYRMWKQRDGTLIRIKDMEDSHLVAAILMCRRTAEKRATREAQSTPSDQDDPGYEVEWFESPRLVHLEFEARARGIEI